MTLAVLEQHDAALASVDQALRISRGFAAAHLNRAQILADLYRFDAALASLDEAISINEQFAAAHAARGKIQRQLGMHRAAVVSFSRALDLDPQLKELHGQRAAIRLRMCDWENFDNEVAEIGARIALGEAVCLPFDLLTILDDAELRRAAGQIGLVTVPRTCFSTRCRTTPTRRQAMLCGRDCRFSPARGAPSQRASRPAS